MNEGYPISRVNTVGDRLTDLITIFRERSKVADVLLINGGLGPTEDDLSARAASLASGRELVFFESWAVKLRERYRGRSMPESNMKQAWLPSNSVILDNPRGTACGFSMNLNRATLFFTPGVPYEMKRMVEQEILPVLNRQFPVEQVETIKRMFTFGLSESRVGELATPSETEHVTLGYRASFPLIEIKIQGLPHNIQPVAESIRDVLGEHIFCEDTGDAVGSIRKLMIQHNKTLALAESCTGGLLADQIVAVPGSSTFFKGSAVVYSNGMKQRLINVEEALIRTHGAVSNEVARAMARNVRQISEADIALAVTGVAGPDGGTEEKPVGRVAVSLSCKDGQYTQTLQFPAWGRHRIRHGSAMICLDMLRRFLLDKPVFAHYDYASRISSLPR
jgi:nicotinamide-nucleotide amidase